MLDAFFWEVHSGLAREGPGDDESTRRAFAMMTELPASPRILDVGCGPGAQTLALAQLTDATITAVDTHQPFLDELNRHAYERGFGNRITTINASMKNLPFDDQSFDLIWSEGAMYMMGFREGLTAWKRCLKPRGYIAVTEPCWLKPENDIPNEARNEWKNDYPAIATVDKLLPIVAETGYREVGHFVLPPSSWWNYYGPMEARINTLRTKYRDDPKALRRLAELQSEIDGYRRYGEYYSYLFVVMQL